MPEIGRASVTQLSFATSIAPAIGTVCRLLHGCAYVSSQMAAHLRRGVGVVQQNQHHVWRPADVHLGAAECSKTQGDTGRMIIVLSTIIVLL